MTLVRYRHLAIESRQRPPTRAELDAIEAALGAKLPASFCDFLCHANGGCVEYVIDVPVGAMRDEKVSFCSVFSTDGSDDRAGNFLAELRCERTNTRIPPGVLPFARDGGGAVAYLDLSPGGRGRVVAYVHGLPEWAGHRTESSFVELATSFDEYVSKLRVNRERQLEGLAYDATDLAHVDAIEEVLSIGMPDWRDDPEIVAAVDEARRRLT